MKTRNGYAWITTLLLCMHAGVLMARDTVQRETYIVRFNDMPAAAIDGDPSLSALSLPSTVSVKKELRHVFWGAIVKATPTAIEALARHPAVRSVEPSRPVSISEIDQDPEDEPPVQPPPILPSAPAPDVELPASLDIIDNRSGTRDGEYSPMGDGAGVRIYVVNTGVSAHREFRGTGKLQHGFSISANPGDFVGSGMLAASIAGGNHAGVAPAASIVSVKVGHDTVESADLLLGLEWIASNLVRPAVVNIGFTVDASSAIDTAVRNIYYAGAIPVVSAGGGNGDTCTRSPARSSYALTVGGYVGPNTRDEQSSFGPCVDLFAPSPGVGASANGTESYIAYESVSIATAIVAGAAANYLSLHPGASPMEVKKRILETATYKRLENGGDGSPFRKIYTRFTKPVEGTFGSEMPTNLRAQWQACYGVYHLTWDRPEYATHFFVYTADNPDFYNQSLLQTTTSMSAEINVTTSTYVKVVGTFGYGYSSPLVMDDPLVRHSYCY